MNVNVQRGIKAKIKSMNSGSFVQQHEVSNLCCETRIHFPNLFWHRPQSARPALSYWRENKK